jgi:uncharacterized membrane protein
VATRAVKAGNRPKLAPSRGSVETGPPGAEPKRPALVPPRWVPITSTILCLIAFADSAYLAFIHYTNPTGLACSTHGFIDCTAVTTSIYSHPFGIPVVDAGLVWCFAMLLLCSPWGWRASSPWVSPLRLAGCVAGVGMVFYLLYVELFELGHLCEFCSIVHLMTIALFIVVAFGTALATPGQPAEDDDMAFAS